MREIGIIKLSDTWSPEYSVNSVVKNQIRVLVSKGFRLRIMLEEGSPPWLFEDRVKYLPVLPTVRFNQEQSESDQVFQEKISTIQERFVENLQGLDMVFCHDILYLGSFLYYNLALRLSAGNLDKITWVHWTHSVPSMDDMPGDMPGNERGFPHNKRYEGLPNSIYISLSAFDREHVARRYQVSQEKVFVVNNTRLNEDYLNLDSLSLKIIEKFRFFEADIVSVLPINLNRYTKQPEIALYLMAALKTLGKNIRLVFANACGKCGQSRETTRETLRMLQLLWLSRKLGLTSDEVVFASDADPRLKNHIPERVIRDLQSMSDIYIHASNGESFGLAAFEAALFRNLCVFSEELEVFRELFGDNVVWIKGGNLHEEIVSQFELETKPENVHEYFFYFKYYQLHESYYRDCAERIVGELSSHKPSALFSRLKKKFNNDTIFNNQLAAVLEYNQ